MQKKEFDALIVRWKRCTRTLPADLRPCGKFLTDILEKQKNRDLGRFADPVDAAAFFCLRELAGLQDRVHTGAGGPGGGTKESRNEPEP